MTEAPADEAPAEEAPAEEEPAGQLRMRPPKEAQSELNPKVDERCGCWFSGMKFPDGGATLPEMPEMPDMPKMPKMPETPEMPAVDLRLEAMPTFKKLKTHMIRAVL